MSIRILIALFPIVLYAGCSSDSTSLIPEESVSFNSLDRGFNTLQIESPKRLTVFSNQVDLEQVWASISGQPIPTLELGSSIVVAEMGTRSGTGVAEIVVENVVEKTEYIEVLVITYIPGPGCSTDSAISTPFHVVQFDRIGPIIFQEKLEIVQCE